MRDQLRRLVHRFACELATITAGYRAAGGTVLYEGPARIVRTPDGVAAVRVVIDGAHVELATREDIISAYATLANLTRDRSSSTRPQ